jgi:hypothetical protein
MEGEILNDNRVIDNNNSIKQQKENNIFMILAFMTITIWIFISFIVGMRFYIKFLVSGIEPPTNADQIVLNTMATLFAVGAFISGIFLGLCVKEYKLNILIIGIGTIVSSIGLVIISLFGINLPDESHLVWVGCGASIGTILLVSILIIIIRFILIPRINNKKQLVKNQG